MHYRNKHRRLCVTGVFRIVAVAVVVVALVANVVAVSLSLSSLLPSFIRLSEAVSAVVKLPTQRAVSVGLPQRLPRWRT